MALLFVVTQGQAQEKKTKKWQADSSSYALSTSFSLYGPLVHPGVYSGIEIPFRRRLNHKQAKKLLVKMGLRDSFSHKIIKSQLTLESGLGVYNHRFNHMGIYLGGNLFYRRQYHTGLLLDLGGELGRLYQVYRDVVVFDERSNPTTRAVASKGYYQMGLNAGLGVKLNKKSALYYRYHMGILFPYNHALSTYRRHELGIRIKRLK